MTEFYQTVMGHRFYESTMPSLVSAVTSLNTKLAALVDGAQANQIEDERAAAMFTMREVIASAIEQAYPADTFIINKAELVAAVRAVEFPQAAPESVTE